MAGVRIHVVMPAELVAAVDAGLPGGVSRGEFVRRAVEQALGSMGADDADPPRVSSPAPAPAEQPERTVVEGLSEKDNRVVAEGESFRWERPRTSVRPDRPFRPYPKGGKR